MPATISCIAADQQEMSSSSSSSSSSESLLKNHHTLIAEILSYLITSTRDLAHFREVSKTWNASVLPYCLKNSSTVKISAPKNNHFVKELVKYGEGRYAGKLYNIDLFAGGFDFWTQAHVVVESMLIVRDNDGDQDLVIGKQQGFDFQRDCGEQFARYCDSLHETRSWEGFQHTGQQTFSEGLFLSLEDMEISKGEGFTFRFGSNYRALWFPVILTVRLPKDDAENRGDDKVLLKARVPKVDAEDRIYPFVSFKGAVENAHAGGGDDGDVVSMFVGYNVKEKTDEFITCHVPMILPCNDGFYEMTWDLNDAEYYLPVESLWRRCQEAKVQEGVAIADSIVPLELTAKLMAQIYAFDQEQISDYHPHSNEIVRDIVHPALYSYIKGISPMVHSVDEIPPVGGRSVGQIPSNTDYWGRNYEASAKYQWLPTYFDIALDGSCTICDYINNLVPRAQYENLYTSLAQLFSHSLPLVESVYSYCRIVKTNHLREQDEEMDWRTERPTDITEVPTSLRGQRLQVVTKIVDYELAPGQSYEGVWHVEGMSHEEIVATVIYFIDRDEDVVGGNILFKRAFHREEANFLFSSVDQMRPQEVSTTIEDGLMPLGQVETIQGRLLVFPNSHVHEVTKLENRADTNDTSTKKKRRIVVFFLINPERRIVSTREVPMQQEHVGGTMKREDALAHRLELMQERKYTKQDWNVREIELCEH